MFWYRTVSEAPLLGNRFPCRSHRAFICKWLSRATDEIKTLPPSPALGGPGALGACAAGAPPATPPPSFKAAFQVFRCCRLITGWDIKLFGYQRIKADTNRNGRPAFCWLRQADQDLRDLGRDSSQPAIRPPATVAADPPPKAAMSIRSASLREVKGSPIPCTLRRVRPPPPAAFASPNTSGSRGLRGGWIPPLK